MSFAGRGIVAIWHDIVPEGRQEFYEWHNREHMPERMAIPGFRRGRRYIAVDGNPQFFCFYEGENLDVVAGPDYFKRLNNPSEWTRRMMPYFRNMSRSVCGLRYSEGTGEGGFVATLRFEGIDEKHLCEAVLPEVIKHAGIVGVHFCVADTAASDIPTVEKTFRKSKDVCSPSVGIIEGTSSAHVRSAAERLRAEIKAPVDLAVYQLENTRSNLEGAYNGNLDDLELALGKRKSD